MNELLTEFKKYVAAIVAPLSKEQREAFYVWAIEMLQDALTASRSAP